MALLLLFLDLSRSASWYCLLLSLWLKYHFTNHHHSFHHPFPQCTQKARNEFVLFALKKPVQRVFLFEDIVQLEWGSDILYLRRARLLFFILHLFPLSLFNVQPPFGFKLRSREYLSKECLTEDPQSMVFAGQEIETLMRFCCLPTTDAIDNASCLYRIWSEETELHLAFLLRFWHPFLRASLLQSIRRLSH